MRLILSSLFFGLFSAGAVAQTGNGTWIDHSVHSRQCEFERMACEDKCKTPPSQVRPLDEHGVKDLICREGCREKAIDCKKGPVGRDRTQSTIPQTSSNDSIKIDLAECSISGDQQTISCPDGEFKRVKSITDSGRLSGKIEKKERGSKTDAQIRALRQ